MASNLEVAIRLRLQQEGVLRNIAQVSSSVLGLRREFDRLSDAGRNVRQRLGDGMDSISRQLETMRRLATSFYLVFQGAGVVGGLARTAAEFESLESAMRVVFGSAQAAQGEMQRLRAESERLGVPLQTLAQSWLSFAAAARGTKLEGEAAREVFTALTEASVTLGLSQEQLSGALLAVQQMISKGAVSSEELRQQLGERLYGAVLIAARAVGLASEEFNALLERGLIPVERFLPAFAAQLRRELGGGVEDASNTARAAFARLNNAFLELKLEFARSGFMDALVQAARDLAAAFKDEQFRASVREFGQLIGKLTRFVVEHGRELVVLGGVIAGARIGAAVGRLAGPKGAVVGAAAGAAAGGIRAASILPENTANGQDEQRVQDVEAAVARLKRRIEETRHAAAAGLIRPEEAERRIAEDEQTIARLTSQASAQQAPPATDQKFWRDLLTNALGGELTRLPRLAETFDAEIAALKASLKTAEDVLEAAFKARLVKEEDYWQAKGAMQRQALDAEARELAQKMADQQRLIDQLSAVRPKDANQRAEIAERLHDARNKLAELKVQMDALDGRRMVVDLEVRTNLERVRRELEDLKASLREKIAADTGQMTPEMLRAQVEREFRDTLQRLASDAEGEALVKKAIDVEVAKRQMTELESAWRLALETMRNAEMSANIQREQGLITTAEAQRRIAEAHQQAGATLDQLLPKMEAIAQSLGPEAAARVAAFRNELAQVKDVADPVAASLNTSIKSAFEDMFVAIGQGAKTAKDAFLDFARAVLGAIQRILAQRLAEEIFGAFGKAGAGGAVKGFLEFFGLKFSAGGSVPGAGSRDTVPAMLTPGEYVIRRDAVRRFGVAFLDAINGLKLPPGISAGRLAFAAGGVVPAVATPNVSQAVRIVNVVDPTMARDFLESPQGERVVLNVLSRNLSAVRQLLRD